MFPSLLELQNYLPSRCCSHWLVSFCATEEEEEDESEIVGAKYTIFVKEDKDVGSMFVKDPGPLLLFFVGPQAREWAVARSYAATDPKPRTATN